MENITVGDENIGKTGILRDWKEMFAELYHARELLYQMILRDIRVRYKQAAMGFAWAFFMPVLIVASGFLVKYAMAYVAGTSPDASSIAGMAVKAMIWAFFAGCVSFSSATLTSNINLVTKIYFPREVLPMSAVFTQMFDISIGSAGLAAFLFLVMGVPFSWSLLWLIPLVLMLVCFTMAIALFISCANVFYRDVKYIVQIILTFGIFFSPVFFEPIMFGPTGGRVMMLNPLSPIMEGMRLSVVGITPIEQKAISPETEPAESADGKISPSIRGGVNLLATIRTAEGVTLWSPYYLLYSALWAFPGLLLAWRNFHRLEFVLAEYI